MSSAARTTRRGFLKGAALGALAAPYLVSASALGLEGRPAASDRITTGHVGVGGRGGYLLDACLSTSESQVVAVCDTDTGRRERARGAVDKRYAAERERGAYGGCDTHTDFRDLVARRDLDAVVVATPDHWHALVTIAAVKAGKDVYCEKPLAGTVGEGRAVVQAVRRYGRVLQTGSHERSTASCRLACELVQNGRVGKLQTVRVQLPTENNQCPPQPPQPVPEGFDYDMWLGPRPWEPYTPKRCHGVFRWILDYSDGELTDRGAHVGDIAMWGAGPFLEGPAEIEGTGVFPRDGLWNTPIAFNITHTYANGVRLECVSEGQRGVRFQGTDGWIFVHIHGGALEAEPRSILHETIGPGEVHLKRSPGHHNDFLSCVRDRTDPVAHAEAGHAAASFCHLGLIALQTGKKLRWDPKEEKFLNSDEANRMIWRPMRSPWRL